MCVISHWAIFWIIVTYAVADSTKNGNGNAINVKSTRIVFPNLGGDEKRLRQRRDNVTEATVRRSTVTDESSSANVIEDGARQFQYSIKEQIKYKRLRHLSGDQNNTKLSTEKLKNDDTKDSKRKITTDNVIGANVHQVGETISNKTIDTHNNNSVDGENSLYRSKNTRTSTRKKRRKITPTTALNTPRLEVNANTSRDNLSQYLDFGRKISVTTSPRRNIITSSVTDNTDDSQVYVVNASSSDDQNKTSTIRTGPTNSGAAITVPTLNTSSICVSNYRTIRPGIKNLKHEIFQNNTLCRWNATDKPAERVYRQNNKIEIKNKIDNKTTAQNYISEGSNIPVHGLSITPSIIGQYTTKILSTATIMSVTVKGIDGRKSKISSITTMSDAIPRLPRKPERDESNTKRKPELRALYNASDLFHVPSSTLRPSLQPYSRYNATHSNLNRNLNMSKLQYPPAGKIFNNVTLATTETVKTSVANVSEPNIEYLMNTTTSIVVRPETDTLILDLTTLKTTTSNDFEHENSSSTPPIFVTYDVIDKNTENWRYRVRNNTENRLLSPVTTKPTKVTLLSKNAEQNYTSFGEQAFRPVNGFHDAEQFEDNGAERSNFYIVTYVLAGLGVIPLVIGIAIAIKMIAYPEKKKQIFEGSEYSSEYNRNPLEFSAGVTSSPIATKLPRVQQQQTHWEIERKPAASLISAPINSKWEFPRNKLRLQTILGQGNFGQVWKAEADDISGHEGLTRLVAVKMVKEISSTREKEDLIKELTIMQHLGSHPNVVTLLGCCTEKEPYMLIMEYVMYGKLLSFLRDHRTRTHYFNFSDNGDTLTSRDLTVFAYCVARGMEYLQSKQIIHRDLAARNVLIDHNKLCKIADFGMSRYVDESGQMYEHRQSKGALPIRWMAPESLHYSCYTYKTDVWSFGVLMWEIVTLGTMPYASMGARIVMREVIEGYRLEKPKHCKSPLFNVISKCWHSDPKKRPTFSELKQDLLNLLEDPESQGSYVDLDCLVEEMNQSVHGSHSEKNII